MRLLSTCVSLALPRATCSRCHLLSTCVTCMHLLSTCADLCVPVQRLRKLQSRTLIQPGRLRYSPSCSPTSDTKLKCSLLLQVLQYTKRFDTRPCSPTRAVDPLPPRLKKSRVRLLFPNPRQLAELSSLQRMQLCMLLCQQNMSGCLSSGTCTLLILPLYKFAAISHANSFAGNFVAILTIKFADT